uniref:Uncharacterized protein n=1 Tax=Glossina austeni TaxID=7395 RepID=A0A1A9UIE1_GLOAU
MSKSNRGSQLFNKSKTLDIVAEHITRRKPKMKIRTEEKYIEEVVKIIKRDFVPDVEQVYGRDKNSKAFRRKRAAIVAGQIRSALFEATNSVLIWSAEDDSDYGCGERNWFVKKSNAVNNEITSASDAHSIDPFVQLYISKDTNDIYTFTEIMQVATQELKQKFAKLLISSLWSPLVTFAKKECITDGLLQIPKRILNLTDGLLHIPTNIKSENSLLTDD